MKLFCLHDWVVIEGPKSDYFYPRPFGQEGRAYANDGSVIFQTANEATLAKWVRKHSNLICAKCDKLKLNLDALNAKASEKSAKREVVRKKRESAIKRGKMYIEMARKAH